MKFNCFHLWWVVVNFYTYFGFKLDVSGLKITRENHEQIEMRNTRIPEKTKNRLKWVTCRLWQNFHRSASSLAAESWYWGHCIFGSSIISCQARPQKIFLQIPSPNISYFLLVGTWIAPTWYLWWLYLQLELFMRPLRPIWGGHLVFVVVAADQLTQR